MTQRVPEIEAYSAALLAGARQLGIAVSPELVDRMAAHYALVRRWAAKINLTTVLDPARAADLHGLDSLLIAEQLSPDLEAHVADVGSGAGFPGVVIALARPRLSITLIEPIRKRASFLRVALADLARPDVRVLEARLDGLARDAPAPWSADVIVSRATIPPLDLIRRAPPYLSPNGRLILTSGAGAPAETELAACARDAGLIHASRQTFRLPGGETRVIDSLDRRKNQR